MQKFVLVLLSAFCMQAAVAQSDSASIIATIETFFTGMESHDTAKISTSTDTTFFLYSIMKNRDGKTLLDKETQEDFYGQVISLKGKTYDEQILSYDIKIDGSMAIVWAPYKFIFEGKLSHCGVNVFTMIKRDSGWKIMGITDTRRRQGCN